VANSLAISVRFRSGVHNSGREITDMTKSFFTVAPIILWSMCMELASNNHSGGQNFGVGPRFLENVCPPLLGYKEHL
jgi:hypothetical protein